MDKKKRGPCAGQAKRRTFTAAYKLAIVEEYERLTEPGAKVQLYHSAAQIGITQTAARSGTVMKKHNALARRLLDRQGDYLRFTRTGEYPPTTTIPSGTSA